MKQKALVVLSGGQDSTTCLAWAQHLGYDVSAVTFDYNQRHSIELEAARAVARLAGVTHHETVKLGPILKGTSPLTDHGAELETYADYQSMDKIIGDRIETTFVPMRNALFLNIAANRAVVRGAKFIVTGVCEADNANYPDCRQTFISAQEWTINEALGHNVTVPDNDAIRILTPLIRMTKAESIHMLRAIGSLAWLAFSHTAYDGTYPPVSKDHASTLRAQGFVEADLPDPLVLRAVIEGKMDLPDTPNYRYHSLNNDLMSAITVLMDQLKAPHHAQ